MAAKKPEAFTDGENAALRLILKKWRDKAKLSQKSAGKVLGIGQQAVGTLEGGGGFSRPTARTLAETQGFDSPEALLEFHGALAVRRNEHLPWGERDLAIGIARRYGYDEAVLERVIVRYGEDQYANRTARWWNDRISQMGQEFDAERAEQSRARATSSPPAPASGSTLPSTVVDPPKARRTKSGAA